MQCHIPKQLMYSFSVNISMCHIELGTNVKTNLIKFWLQRIQLLHFYVGGSYVAHRVLNGDKCQQ